jgi:hypothetical protein
MPEQMDFSLKLLLGMPIYPLNFAAQFNVTGDNARASFA